MAVPQALCKQKLEARQHHVYSYHKANCGFKGKKRQQLVWAVSCHASSLFFSYWSTPGPWVLMAKAAPATCGYHVCCSVAVSMHMQEKLWPIPFLPKLGLYLGLWHLQLQPKHRLPDQLASSLQWSEPCGIGKFFHKGSGGLPPGTTVPLEK